MKETEIAERWRLLKEENNYKKLFDASSQCFIIPSMEQESFFVNAILIGSSSDVLVQLSLDSEDYEVRLMEEADYQIINQNGIKKTIEKIKESNINKDTQNSFIKALGAAKTIKPNWNANATQKIIANGLLYAIRYSAHPQIQKVFLMLKKEAEMLTACKQQVDKASSLSSAPPPIASSEDYQEAAKMRSVNINSRMNDIWRNIKYDSQNPIQKTIAEKMYGHKDILLLGETGIGKTFNPLELAKQNGIASSVIQFNTETDVAQMLGTYVIRQGVFDSEPTMHFQLGFMAKAFMEARDRAKEGSPTILLLDEVFRANDQSSLISTLSVVGETEEYRIILPFENEFVLLPINQNEQSWFCIDDVIDKRSTWVSLSKNGISGATPNGVFLTSDSNMIQEMHARGDLPTISKANVKKLDQENILGLIRKSGEIRVPQNAIYLVGTSNIGANYSVSMTMDNALFRRLAKVPVLSPSVDYMVDRVIEKNNNFSSKQDQQRVGDIIKRFLNALHSRLELSDSLLETSSQINFSTVEDIIAMVDTINPFKELGFGSLKEALKAKAMDFVDLESDMTAKELLSHPLLKTFNEMIEVQFDAIQEYTRNQSGIGL